MDMAERVFLLAQRGYDVYRIGAVLGLDVDDVVSVMARQPYTGEAGSAPQLIAAPFAFDTPGLDTGFEVYSPAAGDLLLDAWVEWDESWDGTPIFDLSTFDGTSGTGLFATASQGQEAVNLTQPGLSEIGGSPSMLGDGSVQVQLSVFTLYGYNGCGLVPVKFAGSPPAPLKVVVSQDGTPTGGPSGSTVGTGTVYLLMATPVTP